VGPGCKNQAWAVAKRFFVDSASSSSTRFLASAGPPAIVFASPILQIGEKCELDTLTHANFRRSFQRRMPGWIRMHRKCQHHFDLRVWVILQTSNFPRFTFCRDFTLAKPF
jgi:hypothetical protein